MIVKAIRQVIVANIQLISPQSDNTDDIANPAASVLKTISWKQTDEVTAAISDLKDIIKTINNPKQIDDWETFGTQVEGQLRKNKK